MNSDDIRNGILIDLRKVREKVGDVMLDQVEYASESFSSEQQGEIFGRFENLPPQRLLQDELSNRNQ